MMMRFQSPQVYVSFVEHLCYLCIVFDMLSHMLIAALWSPAVNNIDLLNIVCDNLIVFLPLSHVVSWVRCVT